MVRKKFKRQLKEVVKKYLEDEYSTCVVVYDELVDKFGSACLSKVQQRQLSKFMLIFFRSFT